jgi:ABC-2 type transport system permease protein
MNGFFTTVQDDRKSIPIFSNMNKIWLIIQREYWVRVRKRSFIIMTFLGPMLIAGIYAIPIVMALRNADVRTVQVLDESGYFANTLKPTKELTFKALPAMSLPQAQEVFKASEDYALLYVPKLNLDKPAGMKLYSKKNISFEVSGKIERLLTDELENQRLLAAHIDRQTLDKIKVKLSLPTETLDEKGGKSSNGLATFVAGMLGAVFLYASLFIYGVQVMRGVIEEKTNRIVEVIISSVKPIELMLGKIIGVGLVGMTQFLAWIILGGLLSTAVPRFFVNDKQMAEQIKKNRTEQVIQSNPQANSPAVVPAGTNPFDFLQSFNIPLLVGCFLFYFLGGYLLYSALFAAVGSAADAETDTQQFMLPITAPIILSIIMAQFVAREPDGALAFWMSMIPFTSPIIMMVRLPYGVETWQLILSMILLVGGFIGTTWLAARIYRVGVLMYGKKVTFKEMYKWLTYKA